MTEKWVLDAIRVVDVPGWIIDALLLRGAEINLPDHKGWTPLFWATFNGHADIVANLMARGADPNLRTLEGEWSLLWAAYKGYAEIVRLLLPVARV